jgi:hypothetical protein
VGGPRRSHAARRCLWQGARTAGAGGARGLRQRHLPARRAGGGGDRAARADRPALYDREGTPLRELPLGTGRWAWLGSPWSATELPFTASLRAPSGIGRAWQGELRLVDLATGRIRALGGRLAPLGGASPWQPGDDRVRAGAPASRLFRDSGGALVRLDGRGRAERLLPGEG